MNGRRQNFVCEISYVSDAEEADRRHRAGEHQHQCRDCFQWYWALHKDDKHPYSGARHEPRPMGVEVNHFGNLHRARTRKHPCPDCAEAQADYERMVARSDATVADFIARRAGAAPSSEERGG